LRWLGWFGAANSLVILAASLGILAVTETPEGALARAFGALTLIAHSAVLAFLPALLLVPLIFAVPRRGIVTPLATGLAVIVTGVVLIDTAIYQQYRFHLNAEIFNLLSGGAAGEILVFTGAVYARVVFALAGIVLLEWWLSRRIWRRVSATPGRGGGYVLAAMLAMTVAGQATIHAWADAAGYTPVTRQGRQFLASIPLTADALFRRLGVERALGTELLESGSGTSLNYPLHPMSCNARQERPNLLFIVIDSWRFDAFSEAATPHVAALAARSLRFTDHVSGGSATRTGIFTLLYGLPGTYWQAMLAERRGPVLIRELYRQGYEVTAFASAALVSPEFDSTVFADVHDLRLRSTGDRPSARDEDLNRDFLAFLDRRAPGRPFFSFLFYDAPHSYDFPDGFPLPFQPSLDQVNYLALNSDFDPRPFQNRYLNSVHFVDTLIGKVLEALERHGLIDNTVIVVTGDHGQEFNDNGLNYWGHNSNFSRYQVGVPLILHWPGRAPAVIGHRTSHFDIVPTLMSEFLGCSNQFQDYSVGHPLLQVGERETLLLANYADYALAQPDRTTVVHSYGVEVLDSRYRPIPGAKPDGEAVKTSLQQRSRFLR
jgi:membrane-anchored protein YejM (alkaline phosphatase superfamily)